MSRKQWSPNKYIFGALRRIWRWNPARKEVLLNASVRKGKEYRCAKCHKTAPRTRIAVDHIVPVIDPNVGFTTWDSYIQRLFCPKEGLQVLDKSCHRKKTNAENKIRRKRRVQKCVKVKNKRKSLPVESPTMNAPASPANLVSENPEAWRGAVND